MSLSQPISETNLRQTTNDNDFHQDKHHVFFANGKGESSHRTMPDYLRHLEKPQNNINYKEKLTDTDTLFIVSRNQGWITVDKTMNRMKPVEKYNLSGDKTKTSYLTPSWMQTAFPKNTSDNFVQASSKFSKQTFLVDKEQPKKSIWSIGAVRHNVHSKELAEKFNHMAESNQVVRLMEWKEQPQI